MTTPSLPFDLTGRQAEVADAMVKYGCAKMAARELGISFRTVEGTMKRIREKMGVPNQGSPDSRVERGMTMKSQKTDLRVEKERACARK